MSDESAIQIEDQAIKELLYIKELLRKAMQQMRSIESQRPAFISDLIVSRREVQVSMFWLDQCIQSSPLPSITSSPHLSSPTPQ